MVNQTVSPVGLRNFSLTCIAAQKPASGLAALRKNTGYALAKCKAALEKFNGDVDQAAKWLGEEAQKEGWAKAEKVKDRTTGQGTLVFVNDKELHRASILELNCETDFVARSEKFLDISSQLALAIIKEVQPSGSKEIVYKNELNKINMANTGRTISDQLALLIGTLGENMSVRRAVVFNIQPNQHLSWYMHGSAAKPMNQCHFGNYGALVNMTFSEPNVNYNYFDIGRQVCQHIVGMKPVTIGEMPAITADTSEIKFSDDETRLLYQEFLMKSDARVADFLAEHKAVVNDFVRFECGELVEGEPENVHSI